MIRDERGKVEKLCRFINAEVPKLKDSVVEMTAKLDVKVASYLLRDLPY